MTFTKFGKALLMSALSAGVVLSITSCVQSYTVGFLYVTGTVTAQSSSNGIITGYKIDHNTGKLQVIHGLPVSTGGSNPIRAVLLTGSRFMYVLNRGVNSAGNADCSTADPCHNSNIVEFAVGGNGILTEQESFFTQGINPMRIAADSSGTYLYVLDHDAPDNTQCHLALGAGVNACGDVTAFQINSTTGRLQLIVNAQVTSVTGAALPYFPVPADPIDFQLTNGYILALSGTPATGDSAFPYTFNPSNGQLTVNQNSAQPLNIAHATAIDNGGGTIYVLDNEPVTIASGSTFTAGTYCSQMLAYSVGTNGALQPTLGGTIPDDVTLCNPSQLLVESKGKFVYLANQGNNANTTDAQSGIAGYVIDPATHSLSFIAGEPFGSGAGPQCMVEDPSDQFIYTANFNDSTITGRIVDPNSGVLNPLNGPGSYPVTGPPTWCLVDGRTS
jgi:6-phosphogluconolactonase (cycloisomerase 2 family)